MHFAITWSANVDEVRYYIDGSQVGTTDTSLGVWAGLLSSTNTVIGAFSTAPLYPWYGWLAHDAVFDTPLTPTQIADLAVVEKYQSSGTVTSSIFDSGQGSNWGTLTYNATTPANTTVSVKVRTSNNSDMSGATAFGSCSAIGSGSDMSSNDCVTDTERYAQYQVTLATTDAEARPTFEDVSLAFEASDSTPPSISLTALSPDPGTDTTPSISGTATEETGTVSNVQYQIDGTEGTWTACTADDGTFDESEELFNCSIATLLSDGSHTIYIRTTDSNGNTTAGGSESSDSFTIDITAPNSFDLDGPGNNSYSTADRPSFKWKTASTLDVTSGLDKYKLEIEIGNTTGDAKTEKITIDDIPVSRTTDYETNKYKIQYQNFDDDDSTNNHISVFLKSSSEWSDSENNGRLKEGKRSWKVAAYDNAGNERTESRTLFVDRTAPSVKVTQINDLLTPEVSANSTSGVALANLPVASGPKEVEIKIEKKNYLGIYELHTLATVNLTESYWASDGSKITDNSKNINPLTSSGSSKYSTFSFTPDTNLPLGAYKITLTGKDKVDNSASETSLTLNITSLARIITPEEKEIIEKEIKDLPKEEQEKVKGMLEVTKPIEPSALEKTLEKIATGGKQVIGSVVGFVGNTINGVGHGIQIAFNAVEQGIHKAAKSISKGYNRLADNAPGAAKTILTGAGNGVSTLAAVITSTANSIIDNAKDGVSGIAFNIGEKTQEVSDTAGLAIIKFTYNFVSEPTTISDVQVAILSPTSTKISWKTNHPANGKVNYGLDRTYPFDVQSEKRVAYHEFTLTDLQPNTTYYFEVMSHNKNYVYDANREFTTRCDIHIHPRGGCL